MKKNLLCERGEDIQAEQKPYLPLKLLYRTYLHSYYIFFEVGAAKNEATLGQTKQKPYFCIVKFAHYLKAYF